MAFSYVFVYIWIDSFHGFIHYPFVNKKACNLTGNLGSWQWGYMGPFSWWYKSI